MTLSGLTGKVLGIDVRPADGMLYALTSRWHRFDHRSGDRPGDDEIKARRHGAGGRMVTVDFNPVADRLRVIGSDGTNLRANVDDGKVTKDGQLKFADGDMHAGKTPKIIAGAYTNSMKGAKETTLYDVDATGALVKQAPPNDGILNSVGMHGAKAGSMAFDIVTMDGVSEGWLMAGDTLYKIDLATGKGAMVAKIAGASAPVRDIAALPAMMK